MVVVFDLDGTLLDTYPLIRETLIRVFDKHLPEFRYSEATLASFFGPPLYQSFYGIVQNDKKAKLLVEEYRKVNAEIHGKYLGIFPNAVEVLEYLKDKYPLAICSNKVHQMIVKDLKTMKVDHYFDYIVGLDDMEYPKPHPGGLEKIKEYFNDQGIFIGDTVPDILTAQAAKMISVGCTWALTSKEQLIAAKADYIINDFIELIKIMEEIDV